MRVPLSTLHNPNNAKKITIIEGPDGVGKTTLVNSMKERFGAFGKDARLIRCPDNRGGATIRNVIMSEDLAKHPQALIFLFLADFVYAFESLIEPELDNPDVYFLFDRFIPSTCIYQKVSISYINSVMENFPKFCEVFSKAQYTYLSPSNFKRHKERLAKKHGDEINHLDPVGDENIHNQIADYHLFASQHRTMGLLGSRDASTFYV